MAADFASLSIGALLGGVTSWAITHAYYRRSTKELKEAFSRLPETIQQVASTSTLSKLSVADLNAILRSRVIDLQGSGEFPYKACPMCGSTELEIRTDFHSAEPEANEESGANWVPIRGRDSFWL